MAKKHERKQPEQPEQTELRRDIFHQRIFYEMLMANKTK